MLNSYNAPLLTQLRSQHPAGLIHNTWEAVPDNLKNVQHSAVYAHHVCSCKKNFDEGPGNEKQHEYLYF